MENINLELSDLKKLYDYISESIIIVDEKHDIVLMNKIALKKFDTTEDEILYKNIAELIPVDYQEDVFHTMSNADNSYYDIFLKKYKDNSLFPAFLSGQSLPLKDGIYSILTIVDVTELKEKEQQKVK